MAHALAPIFGVEYYTPMTSVHSYDAGADDGSTGYYVYRLEPEKYQEDLKKAEEEKKKSEEAAKNTTEAAKPQTTESPSGNGGAVSTEAEQTETGVQEMNTSSVNSGGGMEKVGNILGVLITLLSLALILFLVLLI
jgi:cobalamin biosynthesis Mg chelatase CobN